MKFWLRRKIKLDHGGKKILAIFLSTLFVYAIVIVSISHQNTAVSDKIDSNLDKAMGQSRVNLYEQLIDVNPLKGEATVRVQPWPLDETYGLTFRSGWAPAKDIQITVDSILGNSPDHNNLYKFNKDVPSGGFDVAVDGSSNSNSNVSKYPFDAYSFESPIAATYTDDKGQEQNLPILPQDYTKKIDTFDVTMQHTLWTDTSKSVGKTDGAIFDQAVKQYSDGNASSTFFVKRTNSTKLLTLIISLPGKFSSTALANFSKPFLCNQLIVSDLSIFAGPIDLIFFCF